MVSLSWRRPLKRIISGGEPGAEQAGLFAAETCRIPTAGWHGENTPTGSGIEDHLSLMARFNLQPHGGGRAERIRTLILESDATLRLGYSFANPEDQTAYRVLQSLDSEFLDVRLDRLSPIQDVTDWIVTQRIRTLYVTGNVERSASNPVFASSLRFLFDLFRALGHHPDEIQLQNLALRIPT